MVLMNETGVIFTVIQSLTENVTGEIFLSFLLIFLILLGLAFRAGLSFEIAGILLLPLAILLMAFYSAWFAIGGVLLIFLTFIIAKNFIEW